MFRPRLADDVATDLHAMPDAIRAAGDLIYGVPSPIDVPDVGLGLAAVTTDAGDVADDLGDAVHDVRDFAGGVGDAVHDVRDFVDDVVDVMRGAAGAAIERQRYGRFMHHARSQIPGPDAMTTPLRLSLALAAVAALGACTRDDAPTANGASAAAPAAAATPAPAPASAPAPAPAAESQAMTMEQVDRYLAATVALGKATEADPALEDVVSVNVSSDTQAQHAARLAANPTVATALSQAGTNPEEYARMAQLLPAAFFAYGMMQAGQLKEVPEGIDPALIEFMKAHGTEIAAKMKAANGG